MKTSRMIKTAWVLCLLGVSAATAAEPKAYDITIPAVPDETIDIPRVPPVRIHYETQASSSSAPVEETSNSSVGPDRSIGFSKRVPPDWGKSESAAKNENAEVGDVNGGRVSLYLRGAAMDADAVEKTLNDAGFKVLAKFPVDKEGKRVSIVFTDEALQKSAAKPGRGFGASLRVLVDSAAGTVSIMNPLYVERAFMQDDFDEATAKASLKKLRSAFKGLKNSEDSLKYSLLPKYHFMDAMPYYQDMIEVGSAKDNETLLQAARKTGKIVFEQKLPNGSVLVGVKFKPRTSKFVANIGYENSALLPYPVLVENGTAKILDPKYYIAVMYPSLSMSNFIMIARIPGVIKKECRHIF